MPNLVMVMPYRAYIAKAHQEGFRISAIWDRAKSDRVYGSQDGAYLADVIVQVEHFGLVDVTDRVSYA